MGARASVPASGLSPIHPMFNFSANRLFLLSRTEYRTCAVFLLQDRDTQRVYRLYDFTRAQLILADKANCAAGKVNSADKLYLVIESAPRTPNTIAIPMPLLLLTAREGLVCLDTGCDQTRLRDPCAPSGAAAAHSCARAVETGAPSGVETGGTAAVLIRRYQTHSDSGHVKAWFAR
jgi:hypothetical protein